MYKKCCEGVVKRLEINEVSGTDFQQIRNLSVSMYIQPQIAYYVAVSRTHVAKDVEVKLLRSARHVQFADSEGFYTKNVAYNEALCCNIFNTAVFTVTNIYLIARHWKVRLPSSLVA
jgi:hypothetical protein